MSKAEDKKKEMGFVENPLCCGLCKSYVAETVKVGHCEIGRFHVRDNSVCDYWKARVEK